MNSSMRIAIALTWLAGVASISFAQAPAESLAQSQADDPARAPPEDGGVPLPSMIEDVARRTGKTFIVDPRVRGNAMVLQKSPRAMSYADLLAVLQVHGFAAVEGADGFVRVVPEANVRQLAVPVVRDDEKRPEAEYITKVIAVRSLPAAHLVPVLRPLMPMQAHLAFAVCTNDLMIVDTVANVRRIEAVIAGLDTGEPYKLPPCVTPGSSSPEPRK